MNWRLLRISDGVSRDLVHGFTLGRSDQNHWAIPEDDALSRRHARIDLHEGRAWVRDLHSANGVYVNGERIREIEVHTGDRIQLGESVWIIDTGQMSRLTVISESGPKLTTNPRPPSQVDANWSAAGWSTLANQLLSRLEFLKASTRLVYVGQAMGRTLDRHVCFGPEVELSSWLLDEAVNGPVLVGEEALLNNRESLVQRRLQSVLVWPLGDGAVLWAESSNETWGEAELDRVGQELEGFVAIFQTALKAYIQRDPLAPFIAVDNKSRSLVDQARRAAQSPAPVLIQGPAGSGKSLLARWIHEWSTRADESCQRLDISLVPRDLVASTLFGHVKGAFTGADRDREGLLVQAHLGTLILENIDDCPIDVQVMLLKVIEDGHVTPLGTTEAAELDLRLVATSRRNLAVAIEDGSFRKDLFYRISAISLSIPSLDERPGDLSPLIQSLADDLAASMGRPGIKLGRDVFVGAGERLWPGQVRELRNFLEQLLVSQTVDDIHWPEESGTQGNEFPTLKELEAEHVRQALKRANWNKGVACDLLGITRPTLAKKIADYNIRDDGEE